MSKGLGKNGQKRKISSPSSDKPTKTLIIDNSSKGSQETHSKMLLSGKTRDKKIPSRKTEDKMQLPTHTEEMTCQKILVLEADVDVQLHEQAEDGNQMPLPLAEDSENVFQPVINKKPVKELSPGL
jgi:hypothetical protein